MTIIKNRAKPYQDPGGCVVCHGGRPTKTTKEEAHSGAPEKLTGGGGPENFYPDPGSIWIADKTCGIYHQGYGDTFFIDEVFIRIDGRQHYLWRAVVYNGPTTGPE